MNIERRYKNAEVSVIVEDGLIDEAKVYVAGELVEDMEISTKANPDGIEFTRKNLNNVLAGIRRVIDEKYAEAEVSAEA